MIAPAGIDNPLSSSTIGRPQRAVPNAVTATASSTIITCRS